MHFFVRPDELCLVPGAPGGRHPQPSVERAQLLPPLILRTDAKLLPFLGKPGNPKSGTFPPCFRAVLLSVQVKPPIAVKADDVKFTIYKKSLEI